MRGSLAAASTNANTNGIIPAHAGLTFYGLSSRFSCRDHPRACGAHRLLHTPHPLHEGSSPRMRGSRKIRQPNKRCNGIIPAHAGLTAVSPSMRSARWDHPRACGAHVRRRSGAFESMGSSPRMRGSRRAARDNLEAIGIIPAHAGLTRILRARRRRQRDHPRACGAHQIRPRHGNCLLGSSPRMRGSQLLFAFMVPRSGIIPAHAGLTKIARHLSQSSRDHPRACGAHRHAHAERRGDMGSSPRMRGSPRHGMAGMARRGIIPAHAGLTQKCSFTQSKKWDHPRACGAHLLKLKDVATMLGSSPRMRGSRWASSRAIVR